MANGFTIQVEGLDKLQRIFKELPRRVQTDVTNELYATGVEWMGKAKADAPVDRGRTKQSVNMSVTNLTLEMSAQSESVPYQEFGTKGKFRAPAILGNYPDQFKGSRTSSVDPITALTAWVARKGIAGTYSVKTQRRTGSSDQQASQNKSLAWAIFKKHQKEGMAPHPFLFSNKDRVDRVTFYYNRLKNNIASILKQIV